MEEQAIEARQARPFADDTAGPGDRKRGWKPPFAAMIRSRWMRKRIRMTDLRDRQSDTKPASEAPDPAP
jgi:hypothetical protein